MALSFSWGPHCVWTRPGVSASIRSRSSWLGASPHLLLVLAAAFSGQPQAVIMTGPLKREGMLASTVSQSNVVITPAPIARVRALERPQHPKLQRGPVLGSPCPTLLFPVSPQAPGVTEFHSGILVTDLGHATSSQPAPVSRLFSASAVQDSLVKGEQVPLLGASPQVAAVGSSRDGPNSGQASPCASEHSPSPQSPQNNCSGKYSADPKNVAVLKVLCLFRVEIP